MREKFVKLIPRKKSRSNEEKKSSGKFSIASILRFRRGLNFRISPLILAVFPLPKTINNDIKAH